MMRSDARSSREAARQAKTKAEAEANQRLHRADEEAKRIVDTAEAKAKEIAGNAYDAMNRAEEYKALVTSLKNIVDGLWRSMDQIYLYLCGSVSLLFWLG